MNHDMELVQKPMLTNENDEEEKEIVSKKSHMINRMLLIGVIVILFLVLLLAMFAIPLVFYQAKAQSPCMHKFCIQSSSIILDYIDTTFDPCENFYEFACNQWLANTKLPYSKFRMSSLMQIDDVVENHLVSLYSNRADPTSSIYSLHKQVNNFFDSCMDTVQVNSLGAEPLIDMLETTGMLHVLTQTGTQKAPTISGSGNAIDEFNEFSLKLSRSLQRMEYFAIDIHTHPKNRSLNVIQIRSSSFMSGSMIRSEYDFKNHYISALTKKYSDIIKIANQDEKLRRIINMTKLMEIAKETALLQPTSEEARNPYLYKDIRFKDLSQECPQINIQEQIQSIFDPVNITLLPDDPIVIKTTFEVSKMCKFLVDNINNPQNKSTIYDLAYLSILSDYFPNLGDIYQSPFKNFVEQMSGSSGMTDRSKICQSRTSSYLPEYSGAIYIKEYFPNFTRNNLMEMNELVKEAAIESLNSAFWMGKETREKAITKVKAVKFEVGYNDRLLDYNKISKFWNFNFSQKEYFKNILQISTKQSQKRILSFRHKILDIHRPQIVNAFYNPSKNKIIFPIAILQGLMYRENFPAFMNFPGIGLVLGHELGHAFDDQGRKYDSQGQLLKWWDSKTTENYKNLTKCFIDQYSKYSLHNISINGVKTLGENIADNIGLKLSFMAYKKYAKLNPGPQSLPGLNYTSDQLFFLAFGNAWCTKATIKAQKNLLIQDVHSPGKYRIIGTVSNSKHFAEAYNCPLGSAMNPIQKCSLFNND